MLRYPYPDGKSSMRKHIIGEVQRQWPKDYQCGYKSISMLMYCGLMMLIKIVNTEPTEIEVVFLAIVGCLFLLTLPKVHRTK
jgi:hypothetical protein